MSRAAFSPVLVLYTLAGLTAAPALLGGCEAIGLKAHITTVTSMNGKTTVKQREAKNWDEFKDAMGEVGTDFSGFAKEVGATTAKLVKKLTDAPPPGQVKLHDLDAALAKYEGNVRFDYLHDAATKPDAAYDFSYVQIGMPEYDDFFRASAEMYGCAYQLTETGRHVRLTAAALTGDRSQAQQGKVDDALDRADKTGRTADNGDVLDYAHELGGVWKSIATLGVKLVGKTADVAKTGVALVASAPRQITNPKLLLHIKLIVKGLDQSVGFVKDTGKTLADLVG
jgi:hypothetical protein